mgnify:CR=1 FL=1
MVVNEYSNESQLYLQLAQKLGEKDSVNKKDIQSSFLKVDIVDITGENKYDKNDYQRVLEKFKNSDSSIRTHEQAHAANGNTTTPIAYKYQVGPDGKMYAVGGEVRLDTSLPDDPKAAAFKLGHIQRASSAPSDMSGADANIAIQANLNKMLLQLQGDEYANQ